MFLIGDNIRNFRLMRNYSQKKLAESLNVSIGTIANWENNSNSPNAYFIQALCNELGISPNVLFGWEKSEELEAFFKEQEENLVKIEELTKEREALDKRIKAYQAKLTSNRKQ